MESQQPSSAREEWKKLNSQQRTHRHKTEHSIPGMDAWLDRMRGEGKERPKTQDSSSE